MDTAARESSNSKSSELSGSGALSLAAFTSDAWDFVRGIGTGVVRPIVDLGNWQRDSAPVSTTSSKIHATSQDLIAPLSREIPPGSPSQLENKATSYKVGRAAGEAVDFLLLAAIARRLAPGPIVSNTLAGAMSGFLMPEQDHSLSSRLKAGAIGAASMAVLEGSGTMLAKSGLRETVFNNIERSTISAALAGATDTQLRSLSENHRWASFNATASGALGWGITGGVAEAAAPELNKIGGKLGRAFGPEFNQLKGLEGGVFVDQAKFAITALDVPLGTGGLATCAGLVAVDEQQGLHYLAHIDRSVQPAEIRASLANIDLQNSQFFVRRGLLTSPVADDAVSALLDGGVPMNHIQYLPDNGFLGFGQRSMPGLYTKNGSFYGKVSKPDSWVYDTSRTFHTSSNTD